MTEHVSIEDRGIRVAEDKDTGGLYRAFVLVCRINCPECGKSRSTEHYLDADLALLQDRSGTLGRISEDSAFIAACGKHLVDHLEADHAFEREKGWTVVVKILSGFWLNRTATYRVMLERWLRLRPGAARGRQVLYDDTEKALKG